MASSLSRLVFLVLTFSLVSVGHSEIGESACLKVATSEFAGLVRSTVKEVQKVISIVSPFAGKKGDSRLSNAVADCLELMDLSIDHLRSAESKASQNPNGGGKVGADIKALLSGALANQDTCLEGFDGTNAHVKTWVSKTINRVTQLTHHLLSMVNPTTRVGATNLTDFPHWLKPHDQTLLQTATSSNADAVVAADGTGKYRTISEAIRAAPEKSRRRYVIYVKKGVYKEYIEIGKKKQNIMMIGDGMDSTIISGDRYTDGRRKTYRTATFGVTGAGFIARDMTFENTAGPGKQAVAYRSHSDYSVLYRCGFRGYQDTLYAHCMRQFYRDCFITGTVDFIFGHATAVFQNCQILARKGLPKQKNTITAQGRPSWDEDSGFSLQFCNISAEPEVISSSTPTYLGRPWRLYSRTVIMQSYIGSAISPQGFLEWKGDFALDTLYYAEYMNYGPGSGLRARVKWPGYHVITDSSQADQFTVAKFIDGNTWLPSTGVTYTAGLEWKK